MNDINDRGISEAVERAAERMAKRGYRLTGFQVSLPEESLHLSFEVVRSGDNPGDGGKLVEKIIPGPSESV